MLLTAFVGLHTCILIGEDDQSLPRPRQDDFPDPQRNVQNAVAVADS